MYLTPPSCLLCRADGKPPSLVMKLGMGKLQLYQTCHSQYIQKDIIMVVWQMDRFVKTTIGSVRPTLS